jgi:hypothetical protein
VLLALTGWLILAPVAAGHPLPNSLITLTPGFGAVTIEIDTPADDLAIAMRAELGANVTPAPAAVGAYYLRHVALTDATGRAAPLRVDAARLIDAVDADVGRYREWRVTLMAQDAGAREGAYTLSFDAVIHQIPNHFALVRVESASHAGNGEAARDVGVIRHDFVTGAIAPLTVDLSAARFSSGVLAMIGVGFVHVLSGLDHVLFLAALLLVAPFRASDGRWRFAGMDRSALYRFAAISGAFTLGHSVSLAAGAFGFDAIPVRLIEALVAASILVAAVHALRPLFPQREWIVAGGFGLIHGLAFSQTLAAMHLGLKAKLGALLGFNLGVELAQLTVMAVALPVLALCALQAAQRVRQAALIAVALIATAWVAQRAFGFPLPQWLTL